MLTNVGAKFAKSVSPVFSACILVCVAVLLPSPGLQASTLAAVTIAAVQKVALTYCIGLLISTLTMNIHFCAQLSESPSRCYQQAISAPAA